MTHCNSYEDLLSRYFAEELDREDRDTLERHLEQCPDCRALAELHREISAADFRLEDPDLSALATARWSVLARLPRSPRSSKIRWVRLAAAAALFILGVGLGRTLPRDDTSYLLDNLDSESVASGESWMLSSVDLLPRDGNQVELRFQLSTPVTMTREVGDPLVALAVEESLLQAPNLGARIRAVGTAGKLASNPKVRATLLEAAEFDSSLAVRLQSLNLLTAYRLQPEVQLVLTRIVENDDAIPVRLLALELLGDGTSSTSSSQPIPSSI